MPGKFTITRTDFTDQSTIGELVWGDLKLFTLEDPVRDKKIKGATAIPYGTYEVILNLSPRFGRIMPRLLNVPNFTGILIHSGNKAEDTEGCILLGLEKKADWISRSKEAYLKFYRKLEEELERGKVSVEIREG